MKAPSVIIITGASQGIGAAVARWISEKDAAVTLVARSKAKLQSVADGFKEQNTPCLVYPADVADPMACQAVVKATVAEFGGLTGLVNNAGILKPLERLSRMDPSDWHYNIQVNLLGPAYLTMAALTELRKHQGRIVNVSSGAAEHVITAASAYCAAKAALNHFTRVLAAEEPQIVSVAVRPGVVDTAMQTELRRIGPKVMPMEQAAYYQNLKRDHQLAPPSDPARVIAWLALHAPSELSGEFLNYDDERCLRPALAEFP